MSSTDDDQQYQSCQATKDNGEPCGVPGRFVDQETGYCQAHGEGGSERMSELGAKGGSKSSLESLKGRLSDTLDLGELPELETHRDAEIWLEILGRTVATGRLEERRCQAAIRAVQSWIDARAERLTAERLEELEAKLEAVTEELEQDAGEPWA